MDSSTQQVMLGEELEQPERAAIFNVKNQTHIFNFPSTCKVDILVYLLHELQVEEKLLPLAREKHSSMDWSQGTVHVHH